MSLWRGFLIWLVLATAVSAQALSDDDYATWVTTATRAESVLETDRASETALDALRTQVAGWRDQFLAAQSTNKDRITALRSQLAALPPMPEGEGTSDPLAERRTELNNQITTLMAPVVRAEEAYSRADSIVREIDRKVLERRTDTVLEMGPSALVPDHWGKALSAYLGAISVVMAETATAWALPTVQAEIRTALPSLAVVTLFVLGVFLWGTVAARKIAAAARPLLKSGFVCGFVANAAVGMARYAVVWMFVQRLADVPIWGLRGAQLLDAVPSVVMVILTAQFILAMRAISSSPTLQNFPSNDRLAVSSLVTFGAVIFAVALFDRALMRVFAFDTQVGAVVAFVLVCLASLVVYRFASHLRAVPTEDGARATNVTGVLARVFGRLIRFASIVAPVLALVGFTNLSIVFVFPMIATIGLIYAIFIVQELLIEIYKTIAGGAQTATDGLLPVLINFSVVLASLPVFALIWGARVANLTEIWTQFKDGISIGGTQISPLDFMTFVMVFTIGYGATRLIQSALKGTVLPKTKLDLGAQNAVVSGFGYVGVFLAAMAAISSTGLDLSSLAIVAGALSVGIGFGLQNIVSNFVSGIILLIERPVSQGDWIEVGGKMGYVRDISVRSTRIETFDRTDVIIPNADLVSGVVTNWTRGNTVGRLIVPVGVAYGTDTRKVEKILAEIASQQPMVVQDPPPAVVFQGFGADSLDFDIRAILRDVNYMNSVKSEINHQIAERFVQEGIEIPFAQRDIYIKNIDELKK
jgi:small-conductance mechanosensitive channel